MTPRDIVLKIAAQKETFTIQDVLKSMKNKYTRAYVGRFIRQLLDEGVLVKSGSTRSATYALASKAKKLPSFYERRYKNVDLSDFSLWQDCEKSLPFIRKLPEHIHSILVYAFTEMANNAIDHSQSKNIVSKFQKEGHLIRFIIEDSGVGVFRNVMKDRKLNSELEAIQDLLKGKVTTMPHAHSGEGIFFTSKAADVFTLDSYGYQLRVDNLINDVFISETSFIKRGTRVTFEIDDRHEGHLDEVFRAYYTDPEDFAFDKTEILLKLYSMGSIYVSRSQAKRVLSGLEKFKTIILDFDKVPGVGQAFCDEIFRVFASNHPGITFKPINMNESVRFMVARVEKP